jgi:dTDP-4-amino-4,6-dideoxygalactose transaminase
MEAFQGAILSVKLKYIEKWTRERQEKAYIYNVLLTGIDEVITPEIKPGRTHSFHLYVIRCKKRDELKKYLQEQGITTGLHYPIPLHLQTAYAHLNYSKGDFPMAERLAGEILSLPMFPELTEVQIHYVLDHIKNFYTLKRRV